MNADELLEQYMLTLCAYREAGGETFIGKRMVCQVILNRARDERKRWPRTISGVVLQPAQFSSFNKDDVNYTKFGVVGDKSWDECYKAAMLALNTNPPLTPANHYLRTDLYLSGKVPWAIPAKVKENVVGVEGAHTFLLL